MILRLDVSDEGQSQAQPLFLNISRWTRGLKRAQDLLDQTEAKSATVDGQQLATAGYSLNEIRKVEGSARSPTATTSVAIRTNLPISPWGRRRLVAKIVPLIGTILASI